MHPSPLFLPHLLPHLLPLHLRTSTSLLISIANRCKENRATESDNQQQQQHFFRCCFVLFLNELCWRNCRSRSDWLRPPFENWSWISIQNTSNFPNPSPALFSAGKNINPHSHTRQKRLLFHANKNQREIAFFHPVTQPPTHTHTRAGIFIQRG